MNSWCRGDPVCMDSTTESLCKSHSLYFFPLCFCGKHLCNVRKVSTTPCSDSTILNGLKHRCCEPATSMAGVGHGNTKDIGTLSAAWTGAGGFQTNALQHSL